MTVDIHTLTLPENRQDWLIRAGRSCRQLALTPLFVQGIPEHLGKSRARAYAEGTADYVSFVDSDDYLLPGFAALIAALAADSALAGVYGDRKTVDSHGDVLDISTGVSWTPLRQKNHPRLVSAPVIYRRAAVQPYLAELPNWPQLCDRVLAALVTQWGALRYVPAMGYAWRQHAGQNSCSIDHDEQARARTLIRRVLRC